MKHSKSIFLAASLLLFANNSFAQVESTPNNPKIIQKIASSELKENGYWGVYQELPNNPLLESDIWLNSDSKTLEIALRRIKAENRFPPIFDLAQSVVFSGGLPPPQAYPKLIEARFLAALEIGEIKSANELVQNYVQDKPYEDFKIKYLDSLFYEGKNEEACSLIDDTKQSKPNKAFLEMRAGCFALHNETSAALLNIDLANQIGASPNIWLNNAILFLSAQNANNTQTTKIEFNGDNGINFAISNAAKLKPNQDYVSKNPLKFSNAMANAKMDLTNSQSIFAYLMGAIKNDLIIERKLPKQADTNVSTEIEPQNPALFAINEAKDIYEFYALSQKIAPKLGDINVFTIDDAPKLLAIAIMGGNYEQGQRFANAIINKNNSLLFALDIAQGKNSFDASHRFENIQSGSKEHFKFFGELFCAEQSGIKVDNFSILEANVPSNNDGQGQLLMALENAAQRNAKAETILIAQAISQNLKPAAIDYLTLGRIIGALNKIGYQKAAKDLLVFNIIAQNLSFVAPKPIIPDTKITPKPGIKKETPKPQLKAEAKSPPTKVLPTNDNKAKVKTEIKTPNKAIPKVETATPKAQTPKPAAKDQAPKSPTPKSTIPKKQTPAANTPNWGKSID